LNILSIQTGHNATVGLMQSGEITALLSQEKLDNIKNSDAFPSAAIDAVLGERGLDADSIDEVVIASHMIFPQHCAPPTQKANVSDHLRPPSSVRFAKRIENGLPGALLPGLFRYARSQRHVKLRAEGLAHLKNRLGELGLGAKPLHRRSSLVSCA
jgi:predicted NodU family carbamoyl transferase